MISWENRLSGVLRTVATTYYALPVYCRLCSTTDCWSCCTLYCTQSELRYYCLVPAWLCVQPVVHHGRGCAVLLRSSSSSCCLLGRQPASASQLPLLLLRCFFLAGPHHTHGALTTYILFPIQKKLSGEANFSPFFFFSKSGCIQMDFLNIDFFRYFFKNY